MPWDERLICPYDKTLSALAGVAQRDMAVVDRKFGVGLGVTERVCA
jgi:hypothetical protein